MAIHIKTLALALTMAAGALGCAAHQTAPEAAPVPASNSVPQADARLAEVARVRTVVEARFAEREQICYTKFFVNHCLDQAKEERRSALSKLRAIEIEASHFKRAHAVEQRDLALAADNAKAEAKAKAKEEAPALRLSKPVPQPAAAPRAKAARQQPMVGVTDQAKRTAKVAAQEKKRNASLQRQREIAAKQAASDASEAAKKPAPPVPGAGAP